MRRREFITLLGGAAAAWPLVASAQQSALPVIGYLQAGSPQGNETISAEFRKGLSEIGYVEGRNVAIDFRAANNQVDKLPELVADLVLRNHRRNRWPSVSEVCWWKAKHSLPVVASS
jgi:putative ABC transport system substrate-binding protein